MPRGSAKSAEPRLPGRAFWSGTITFGLVSIPVNLFAAAHARETSMRMVDAKGRPLGRQYFSEDDRKLDADDLVHGYELDSGRIVVVTDEELDAVAPEMTRDIELREFVALEDIPPTYYDHPYLLVPSGKSTKAYHLLAATMERTKRAGIGTFVMRAHQYMAAIVADGGLLRLQTLRFAKEVRTPPDFGLPRAPRSRAKNAKLAKAIVSLKRPSLDPGELTDRYAAKLHALAGEKLAKKKDVVHLTGPAVEEEEGAEGAKVVDLMKLLRQSLGAKAEVTTAAEASPEGDTRRARRPAHKRRHSETKAHSHAHASHGHAHARKSAQRSAHHAR